MSKFKDKLKNIFKLPSFKKGKGKSTPKKKQAKAKKSKVKKAKKTKNNDGLNFIESFYAPHNRPSIHRFFILFFIALFVYWIIKLSSLFLVPTNFQPQKVKAPTRRNKTTIDFSSLKQDIAAIKSANHFKTEGLKKVIEEPKEEAPLICTEADKETSLDLALLSTVVMQDSVKSVASVQVRNKDLLSIREGETIPDMAEISKISRRRIVFKNLRDRTCEFSEIPEKIPPRIKSQKSRVLSPAKGKELISAQRDNRIKTDGNNFKIKKSLRDEMLGNVQQVLTQAKAIKIKNPDGSMCFKMTQVVPGSIYSQLDIANDDIICEINGEKITNLNQLFSLFGELKNIDKFQLGIKRGGSEMPREYNFE